MKILGDDRFPSLKRNGSYTNIRDTIIAVGNENAVDERPVIPANRWEDIADLVQASGLSDYQAPDPDEIDANNSKIEAIWRKDDSLIVDEYNGSPASNLRDLLQTTAAEAISRPQAE